MRTVAVSALALVFAATSAVAAEPQLQISYPTDGALDCAGLTTEIARMDGIMGVSSDTARKAEGTGKAVELGTSAAINGALYSGALGAVPGAGLLANGLGGFAKNRAAAKKKQAEETQRTAETRRAMLMGIYQGKSCATATAAAAEPTVEPAASVAVEAEVKAEAAPTS
ncbi:MAG TPA: hypothetical protein VD906_13335 [Caulobacteraceae bacterium]|nr:hypothetical protein [Caulobacteraceae bacterium]